MRHALLLFVILVGCGDSDSASPNPAPFDPQTTYAPDVEAAALRPDITNQFFPAPVGAMWVYEATTDEGLERIEVSVEAETRTVWGATARVIRDTVYLNDVMIEDTRDWYAQDDDGNVWYLGEETYEYDANGNVICDCGSWESGVGGALPGVVMLADMKVGESYRQEYLAGEAEDYADVVSLTESVTVPAGSYTGCLQTRDRSAIEPELDEQKYYCPGVGNVLVIEEDVRVELIEVSGL